MKTVLIYLAAAMSAGVFSSCQLTAQNEDATAEPVGYLQPVRPGIPGERPFWNINAQRFIYAPAFDFPEISGAETYEFVVRSGYGQSFVFSADEPWAPLSPVWAQVPEGFTTLTVLAKGPDDKVMDTAATRTFYRSPGFSGDVATPQRSYKEASRLALKAIFERPEVQYWLEHDQPDPAYKLYCYPNKLIGALIRAMSTYSQEALEEEQRADALTIGRRMADYLLSVPLEEGPYEGITPTYLNNVDHPTKAALNNMRENWFMVMSATDAGFGFLDLYDVTKDKRYLDMAIKIADRFKENQQDDGTWHHMIDYKTGEPISPQRLNPTWIIFYYDRLARDYNLDGYQASREKAWQYIVSNPLKTYRWDAQFEDVKLRKPYMNMSREQACDVALLLLSGAPAGDEDIAEAEELLRYAEDQFVVWGPVKDCPGWRKAMPNRRKACDKWIANVVLEQYDCYDPVARSSAILINTYLKAHETTGRPVYLDKAKALTNALLEGQAWHADHLDGNGQIPTWVLKEKRLNWLNNSYYAADAVLNMANYVESKTAEGK